MHDCVLVPDDMENAASVMMHVEDGGWFSWDIGFWDCPQSAELECRSSWDFVVEVHASGDPTISWQLRGA